MDSTTFDKKYVGSPCDGCETKKENPYACNNCVWRGCDTRNSMNGASRTQPH